MTTLSEIELAALAECLTAAGESLAGPLSAIPIPGGRSNVTMRLEDGSSTWVLRMPPKAGRTPSAHDVAREHRVISALAGTGVPVPRAVLRCDDEGILGVPFAVSAFVPGRTVRTMAELDAVDDRSLDTTVKSLVETLAALHRVDHGAIGLEGFGPPVDYAARQLARWSRQWSVVGIESLGGLEAEVRSRIEGMLTPQSANAIIHGDYRIDNTLLDPASATQVVAVVDWELSTIGDPVADVATMAAYRHPAFDLIVGEPSAWTSPRLPSVTGLAARYELAGGHALEGWDLHLALAHYKIAVVAAGIDYRTAAGTGAGVGFETAGAAVAPYLEAAADLSTAAG